MAEIEEIGIGAAAAGAAALTKTGRKVLKTAIKGGVKGVKLARKALFNRYLALYVVGSAPTRYQPAQTPKVFEQWLRKGRVTPSWYRRLSEDQRRVVYENFRVGSKAEDVKNLLARREKLPRQPPKLSKKQQEEFRKFDDQRRKAFLSFEKKLISPGVSRKSRGEYESELAAERREESLPEEQARTIEAIAQAAEELAQDPDLFLFQPPAFVPGPDPVVRASINTLARQIGPERMLTPEELETVIKVYRQSERQHYEQNVQSQEYEARRQWIASNQRISELAESEFQSLIEAYVKPDPTTGLPTSTLTTDQVEGLKQEAAHRARRRIQQELESLGSQPAPAVEEEAELAIRGAIQGVAPVESFGTDLRAAFEGLLGAL